MGSSESKQEIIGAINESKVDLHKFLKIFSDMAVKDSDGLSLREMEWSVADYNGTDKLSLAECWGWVQTKLLGTIDDEEEAMKIYRFYQPSYILAFNDAKDIDDKDDYVTKSEFRVLVAYLCIYAAMLDCFSLIDGGGGENPDDRRISLEEWVDAYPNLKENNDYGFTCFEENEKNAQNVFEEIDTNSGGMILLSEFCAYLKACEIKGETLMGEMLNI